MFSTRPLALTTAVLCASPILAPVQAQNVDAELFLSGLIRPVWIGAAPGDDSGRLFIIEKRGVIRIYQDGALLPEPFLDIDADVGGGTSNNSEQGLLGLAFHPDFQDNGYFYIDYTTNSDDFGQEDTIIARYSLDPNDPNKADPNSAMQLLRQDQPFSNHNAGWIEFGPNDGYLYIAFGDGGSGNDPGNRAQTIVNQHLGKILRIDVDGDDFPSDPDLNYAIPQDNPFVGEVGDDEIWAYGVRNPWRAAFDRLTGDLYIGDVGQDAREEVDFIPFDSPGGVNFGWRCMEGVACTGLSGCTCNGVELTLPIWDYNQAGTGRCSAIGGVVYRGCAISDFQGYYITADYCSNEITVFKQDGGVATDVHQIQSLLTPDQGDVDNIVHFGQDFDGEVYIIDQDDGHIFKIVPADGKSDCPASCGADCDMNGELNILDFVCFQSAFSDQDAQADCNEDGDLNILDFVCYQGLFQQGCP